MRTFVWKWSTDISDLDATATNTMSFELEISRYFIPLKINIFTGTLLSYFIRFVKLGGEIVVSWKVSKSMTEKFLSILDRLFDDEPHIIHLLIPWSKATSAINDDIL